MRTSNIKSFIWLILAVLAVGINSAEARSLQKAPDFSGKDLQGKVYSLDQYRGRPLVLYFWATWCPACRTEVDNFRSVYKAFHRRGVEFVSVSLDTHRKNLQQFIETKKIPYPVLYDGKGWDGEIARTYDVMATPFYFVLNPKGEVTAVGSWAHELAEDLSQF